MKGNELLSSNNLGDPISKLSKHRQTEIDTLLGIMDLFHDNNNFICIDVFIWIFYEKLRNMLLRYR
jgi:hypothetical protein